MRRIGLAGVLAFSFFAPHLAEAQPVKIGVLCVRVCPSFGSEEMQPLTDALAHVGLVRGRTLMWDIGSITNSEDQITVAAQTLVSRHPTSSSSGGTSLPRELPRTRPAPSPSCSWRCPTLWSTD